MGQARDDVQHFYLQWAAGDLDGVLALFGAQCTHIGPAGPQDNDQWRAYSEVFRNALPDARMEIVAAIEAGDTVAIQGRFTGTHSGALTTPQGEIPPSGNAIDVPYADFFRLQDGKFVEHQIYWDQLEMMAQLGAGPPV